jgi:LacI family transcriptional regulator
MRISSDTRQRVLQAATELNYHPDISARRLVTGRTGVLAYVERQAAESAFADVFLPSALRGVHAAAEAAGYEVMFLPVPEENAERLERLIAERHVDGVILSGPRQGPEELRRLQSTGALFVLQGSWPDAPFPSVDIDNVAAAHSACRHLIGLGRGRPGMIVHAPAEYTAATARLEGFRRALDEAGLDAQTAPIVHAAFTPESGQTAVEQLLDGPDPPEALFVSSDTVALGVLHALKERGLRVPDDVALVGFDDIPTAVYVEPPLTTVHVPAFGLGWGAADLALRLIRGDDVIERHVLLEAGLIVRRSCGAAPRSQPTERPKGGAQEAL